MHHIMMSPPTYANNHTSRKQLANCNHPSLFVDADLITQLSKPQTPIYQKLAALAKKGYDGGTEAVRKAFYLYRSCMDEAAIEDLGVTPLRNLIAERLGMPSETSITCELL